jgi:neutral ceramidase
VIAEGLAEVGVVAVRALAGIVVCVGIAAGAAPAAASELRAGTAEGFLEAPIGLPLSGYTSRWSLFGFERPDARAAPLARQFAPSTAVHTRPVVKAVALDAAGQVAVLVKVDLIFADAFLLRAVEDLASQGSGEDLHGRILLSTSHSHNSPGRFTQNTALMAGADTYHENTFRRFAASIAAVVVEALAGREPARIGLARSRGFDPLGVDAVFRDRRAENDHLAADGSFLFEGDGTVDLDSPLARGPAKDPALTLLRVDRADRTPLAVVVHFGIHGTALGDGAFALDAEHPEPHLWMSGEAATAVEWRLQELFPSRVVVMHLQGAAGDQSPAGDDLGHPGFARLELLAERAGRSALALWQRARTLAEGVSIEVVTRQVRQDFGAVRVDRGGAVDFRYVAPPATSFDGDLFTFEDFGFPLGGGLCGGRELDLFGGNLLVELLPHERAQVDRDPASATFGRGLAYGSCLALDAGEFQLLGAVLDPSFAPDRDLPLPESLSSVVSALVLDGIWLHEDGRSRGSSRVLLAAAPGEPTTPWSERLTRRAESELGFTRAIVVGYAQDHEGYLLLPEDWLSGGSTEVQINLWGPLQGEYLLERILDAAAQTAPPGVVAPDEGPIDPPPAVFPDVPFAARATPLAGTALVEPAVEVERLASASFTWIGGDPALDQPRVVLEREGAGGVFSPVLLPSGRPLDDAGPRIVVSYRPEPIAAAANAIAEDRYTAVFQVVEDRSLAIRPAAFPLGRYRFRVEGQLALAPGPARYEVASRAFRVRVTDDLEIQDRQVSIGLGGVVVRGRVVLPDPRGYRLFSASYRSGDPIPVARAQVGYRAGPGAAVVWSTEADADGRFVLQLPTTDRVFSSPSFPVCARDRHGNLSADACAPASAP